MGEGLVRNMAGERRLLTASTLINVNPPNAFAWSPFAISLVIVDSPLRATTEICPAVLPFAKTRSTPISEDAVTGARDSAI